jgi:hypothetical protein
VTVCAGISGTVNDLLISHAGQGTKKEQKKKISVQVSNGAVDKLVVFFFGCCTV